ncbi:hypothetical protein RND71_044183 [Anisodus tanguticus]|uniref:B3 domain-containing protein n=1 Tax=Anisodus tanguticus TaxID=243964 RepID=A0AAE1QNP7_9SOLA|nr:hypothetical protein RND71_044183 [Anisodus tanguticus]
MIKKAVENNNSEEQESGVFKINWGAGVRNQEFFRLKMSQKHEHNVKALDEDRGNTMSKITLRVSANFAFGNPKKQLSVIRKSSREVTNHVPLGFNNEDRFLNEKWSKTQTKKKLQGKRRRQRGTLLLPIPQKEVTKFLRLGEFFLNLEEEARLSTHIGGKMSMMSVTLIEPSRQKCKINLRKWFMNKDNGKISSSYVLVTYWNEVVRRNALKSGTLVQLWAFRKGEDLCFALIRV